jgi:hypothetical protein
MDVISRSCANHLISKLTALALALFAGFAVLGPVNVRAEAPDVSGAWHVLVHYKDAASSGAERERWDDRAWVFEREGDGLRWTEYPIVVFDDETGRFEKGGKNRASRVLHHWQPDEAQIADIKNGLVVNERGMAAVTLLRSEGSWVSAPEQATSSASMIRYVESWRVDPAAEGPIFKREDALRSETAGRFAARIRAISIGSQRFGLRSPSITRLRIRSLPYVPTRARRSAACSPRPSAIPTQRSSSTNTMALSWVFVPSGSITHPASRWKSSAPRSRI